MSKLVAIILVLFIMNGCSDGADQLEGKWKLQGFIPITIEFRDGESEAMGIIDKVAYKSDGSDIIVTYESGISKGSSVRITMVDANNAKSSLGSMKRIK